MTSLDVIEEDGIMTLTGLDPSYNMTTTPGGAAALSSVEFMKVYSPVALYVDRSVTPIWYIIGITGNLLSAKIWMERRMRLNNSSAVYLVTLSITDLVFLLLHILQELKYAWGMETLNAPAVCEGFFMFSLVAQYLSPILVLGFTVERWIAVCHPFKKEKYCTTKRAITVVILLITMCLLLCAIQAYFWTYDAKLGQCTMRESASEGGNSLWSVWTWCTEMLIFLLVPVVILGFNIMVIREVRRVSRSSRIMLPGQTHHGSNHAATTAMLLSVSFYVIITTLPATLVYALFSEFPPGDDTVADIEADPVWHKYFVYLTSRKIVEEICLSHYACNFFLYLINGAQFRKAFLETIKCSLPKYNKENGSYLEVSQKAMWQQSVTSKV